MRGKGKRKQAKDAATLALEAQQRERIQLIIQSKYQNPRKSKPSPLEAKICQYLVDLEASNKELKVCLCLVPVSAKTRVWQRDLAMAWCCRRPS